MRFSNIKYVKYSTTAAIQVTVNCKNEEIQLLYTRLLIWYYNQASQTKFESKRCKKSVYGKINIACGKQTKCKMESTKNSNVKASRLLLTRSFFCLPILYYYNKNNKQLGEVGSNKYLDRLNRLSLVFVEQFLHYITRTPSEMLC